MESENEKECKKAGQSKSPTGLETVYENNLNIYCVLSLHKIKILVPISFLIKKGKLGSVIKTWKYEAKMFLYFVFPFA